MKPSDEGLLDELLAGNRRRVHPTMCRWGQFVDELDVSTSDAIEQAVKAQVASLRLYKSLKARGFDPPSDTTISMHLNGLCRCFK